MLSHLFHTSHNEIHASRKLEPKIRYVECTRSCAINSASIIGANTLFHITSSFRVTKFRMGGLPHSLHFYCRLQRLVPLILIFTQWGTDSVKGSITGLTLSVRFIFIKIDSEISLFSIEVMIFCSAMRGETISMLAKIYSKKVQQR